MGMADERLTSKPHLATVKQDDESNQLSQRVRSLRLPEQAAAGGSFGRGIWWVLFLLLAACTAVLGYREFYQPKPEAVAPAPPKTASALVRPVAEAPPTAPSGNFALESKGYIIPAHQILVSPKVGGMVVKLRITESQRVNKGDVLAELEDTEFRADRDRAKAMLAEAKHNLEELEHGSRPEEVGQARAELAEAEAQRVQFEADYKRAAEMLSQKVISREAYDAALSRYKAIDRRVQRLRLALKLMEEGPRIERIDMARAQVHQAEAELAKAEWRLSNCIIRADLRHDTQEECRRGKSGQPDCHAGILQPLRNGRPLRLGGRSVDPRARYQQDFQGTEVPGAGRGLSAACLSGSRVAADAHGRSCEGRHLCPCKGGRAAGGRRSLSEAGDGSPGVVFEQVVCVNRTGNS